MVLRGPRQFLDRVVFMPVARRQCWVRQKTVVFRSCSSGQWTCPLLRRQVHLGFTVQKTVEVPQLPCLVDVCSQFIDGCERPCAHAETLFFVQFLDKVVDMPVVSNDRCAWRYRRCSSSGDQAATSWGARHDASVLRFFCAPLVVPELSASFRPLERSHL